MHLPSRIKVLNSGKGSCISFFFLIMYSTVLGLSCDIWDLPSLLRHVRSSSLAKMEPGPPALGVWSLSHWTSRDIPAFWFYWLSGGAQWLGCVVRQRGNGYLASERILR